MSRINYDPTIWGPYQWFCLETICRSLPESVDYNLQQQIKSHLVTLSFLLPCESCQTNMKEYNYINKIDIADFSTRDKVKEWINNFHNIKLKKKRSLKEVDDFYEKIYSKNITQTKDLVYIFFAILVLALVFKYLIIRA